MHAEPISQDATEPATSDPHFWTVAEFSTLARVSKMSAYRLIHQGDLPAVHIGRSLRIPSDAVAAYLGLPASQPPPAS